MVLATLLFLKESFSYITDYRMCKFAAWDAYSRFLHASKLARLNTSYIQSRCCYIQLCYILFLMYIQSNFSLSKYIFFVIEVDNIRLLGNHVQFVFTLYLNNINAILFTYDLKAIHVTTILIIVNFLKVTAIEQQYLRLIFCYKRLQPLYLVKKCSIIFASED